MPPNAVSLVYIYGSYCFILSSVIMKIIMHINCNSDQTLKIHIMVKKAQKDEIHAIQKLKHATIHRNCSNHNWGRIHSSAFQTRERKG